MKSSISRFSVVFALLGAFAPPALAAPTPADSKMAAEVALKAGQAYRAGKFKEAAELFLEAYRLSERPAQLRNAAKAYQEGGMLDEATTHWTRYRDHAGVSADERREAEAQLNLVNERRRNDAILKTAEAATKAAEGASAAAEAARKQVEQAEASRKAAPAVVAAPREEPGSPIVSYVMIGGGAAATITGSILWFVASGKLSDLDAKIAMRDSNGRITGTTPTEVQDEVSSINGMRTISGVLFSGGLAVAAAGVLWLILDDGEEEPGGPRVSLFATPEGAGFAGTF